MIWLICGSCYTLITAQQNAVECPRCRGALNPTSHERLRKFIDNGIDPTSKGIRLQDAQKAAKEVVDKLEKYERFVTFAASYESQGEDASSALLLLISEAQSLKSLA